MNPAILIPDPSLPGFVWFLILVPLVLALLWGLLCLPILRRHEGDDL
jgi:hypothetical protein